MGLDDVDPKKRAGAYSGGMKRRLDLALALVNDPRILFLDEPTTGLDPASRVAIWEEVRRLNKDLGMTIFLTTQYLEEADRLAVESVGVLQLQPVARPRDEHLREVGGELLLARPPAPVQLPVDGEDGDVEVHEPPSDRVPPGDLDEVLAGLVEGEGPAFAKAAA